ncbi:MAG: ORF6N domain-containing protein [Proteobacteria bacterium]|nr:ORF6N domain-containing protein [Pseudomonadota bacterium]
MDRKTSDNDRNSPARSTELQPASSEQAPEIENHILIIRGQRVMIDADLAYLYGVSTKRLNEQVKRNHGRFPPDFMFKLTNEEWAELVANCDRFKNLKHSTSLPTVFTEHGAVMLANILRSKRAVDMSVYVVRAFIRLREAMAWNKELAKKIDEIEQRMDIHDKAITSLFNAIKKMIALPPPKKKKIGFIH